MSKGKHSLLRKLTPKSYHFDGYNEVNYPNTRDKPFFAENVIQIGNYYLTKRLTSSGNLTLEYSSVCPNGIVSFEPYTLSFESFIKLLRTALDDGSDFITFEIKTNYKYTDDNCIKCIDKNKDCSSILASKPSTIMAAVSFEISDIKNALSVYFGINKQPTKGGHNIMNNMKNIFGINIELGLSKDKNIASTLMGVAVRNPGNGNWYIFDSVKNTRTNLAGMKMGDFPVFLLPTKTLQVGDLTKMDGEYYYVQAVDADGFKLLGAADGIIRQMLPSDSIIPGMTLYTKVVAFDIKTLSDPNSKENLSGNVMAAMFLMQCQKGDSNFSLDNITNDSYNGLGECLPFILALNGSNSLNSMFGANGIDFGTLMMLSAGTGSNDANGLTQMLALNALLGGNSMFGSTTGITQNTTAEGDVYCPECGETYPAGTNFCSKCGTHTQVKGTAVCKNCGTILNDGAAFCHSCGQKVVVDTCPKCKAQVTADSRFCSACGTALTEPAAKKTSGSSKTATKKATSAKKEAKPEPASVPKE